MSIKSSIIYFHLRNCHKNSLTRHSPRCCGISYLDLFVQIEMHHCSQVETGTFLFVPIKEQLSIPGRAQSGEICESPFTRGSQEIDCMEYDLFLLACLLIAFCTSLILTFKHLRKWCRNKIFTYTSAKMAQLDGYF